MPALLPDDKARVLELRRAEEKFTVEPVSVLAPASLTIYDAFSDLLVGAGLDASTSWCASMPAGKPGWRRVNRAVRTTRHIPGGMHFLANAPAEAWTDLPAGEALSDMGGFRMSDLQPGDELHLHYPLGSASRLRVKVRSQHDRVNPWAPPARLSAVDFLAELPRGSQLLHVRIDPLLGEATS